MVDRSRDSDLILALLLSRLIDDDVEPFFRERLYKNLHSRFRDSDPDLRFLLEEYLLGRPRRRFSKDREYEIREIAKDVFENFQSATPESTLIKFSRYEEKLDYIENSLTKLGETVKETENELKDFRGSAVDYLWLMSSGINLSEAKLTRYLPVRIFVSDPLPSKKSLNKLATSVEELLADENFEKSDDFPEESGSWWKRFALKTKDVATSKSVTERLEKVERATEIAMLDKPQAEANQCQAQAAASLISSLSETQNACIQAGSLLVVKATANGESAVIVRTLTPLELKHLEENQSLLRQPDQILDWLQSSCQKQLTRP